MDLCLAWNQHCHYNLMQIYLQLLGLPRRQDLAHGGCEDRCMKLEDNLIVLLSGGDAPGRGRWMKAFASSCLLLRLECDGECAILGTRMFIFVVL